jgi:trehalose 6-phosphate synthase/phosphatase
MSQEEAEGRWADLHSHVNTQTAQAFATSFLNRTIRVNYKHHIKDSLSIPPIDALALRERYHGLVRPGSKRLVLIDLEATLWPLDTQAHADVEVRSEVPTEAMQLLERLVADERNEVWGLSGLAIKGRLEHIARKLPKLNLWSVLVTITPQVKLVLTSL